MRSQTKFDKRFFHKQYGKGIGEFFSNGFDALKGPLKDLSKKLVGVGSQQFSDVIVPFVKEKAMELLSQAQDEVPKYIADRTSDVVSDILKGNNVKTSLTNTGNRIKDDSTNQVKSKTKKLKNESKAKSQEVANNAVRDSSLILSNLIAGKGKQQGKGIKLL
jgi:hypothetical protein